MPPPHSGEVSKKLLTFMDMSPNTPSLLIGDFNNYLHSYWDRFHQGGIDPGSRPTSLSRILDEVGLCDIWQVRIPTLKQYSCFSSSNHALSRIDFAIGSNSILPLVAGVEYLTRRSVPDPSPLRAHLTLGLAVVSPRHFWRLKPFWAQLIDMALEGDKIILSN